MAKDKKKTKKSVLGTILKAGALAYAGLFTVFYFDLDGKLLYYVVEPLLNKHYDKMERKNPLESPYEQVPEGKESL